MSEGVDELRHASERIEHLVNELRASTASPTWARIEEILASVTELYGRGLERVLACVASNDADGRRVREKLCEDPLVESLLLLHGLHPLPVKERTVRAVDRVCHGVRSGEGRIRVVLEEQRTIRLYFEGDWRRCPVPAATVESHVRTAVEEAAPEVVAIVVERPAAIGELVQIDLGRSRRPASASAAT
jgi:hypothetical protein